MSLESETFLISGCKTQLEKNGNSNNFYSVLCPRSTIPCTMVKPPLSQYYFLISVIRALELFALWQMGASIVWIN